MAQDGGAAAAPTGGDRPGRLPEAVVLVAILALAAGLRFYRLDREDWTCGCRTQFPAVAARRLIA